MASDPEKDKKAIKKLNTTKKANSIERTQRRLAGNDSKKTRDGGTTRRNWR
ncbi:MAG TPA: hypothetical protein VIQ27_16605 [Gemmatimonadales bacterium]|jgi:hypothetical protein